MKITKTVLFSYGIFGFPLALVALPIYVMVPQLYVNLGLSLTTVGLSLLLARIVDAFIDPYLGNLMDENKFKINYAQFILISVPFLLIGYPALFHPPNFLKNFLFYWFLFSLTIVYLGFSIATIAHNSWGANLTKKKELRSQLTGSREYFSIIGVIFASGLPYIFSQIHLTACFIIFLIFGVIAILTQTPKPNLINTSKKNTKLIYPFTKNNFKLLCLIYSINGIAASIPATLFLFFVADHLRLPEYSGLFLIMYFLSAALFLPLWVKIAKISSEAKSWLFAMLLAIFTFIWALFLNSGDLVPFSVICIFSGAALGADLALPPAILAGIIYQAGDSNKKEGSYFGLWSWITKINLALAAGITLPLLELMGYLPGNPTQQGNHALLIGYALIPCLLKLLAAFLLWRSPLKFL